MFILLPVGKKARLTTVPYVTSALIILNVIIFALTWPGERKRAGYIPATERCQQLSKRLFSIALSEGSGLPEEYRLKLEEEQIKEGLPSPAAEEIFEAIESGAVMLVDRAHYEWGMNYPLYKAIRASASGSAGADGSTFYKYGAKRSGPYFPNYLTYQFLHAGILHIFFNMLFLWIVGCNIEDRWGGVLFLSIYLAGGVAAVVAQNIFHPVGNTPMVGASGSVAAVMGAFLVRHYAVKIRMFYFLITMHFRHGFIDIPAWVVIPLWLLQQVFMGLMTANSGTVSVGYWAHIGGCAFGIVLGLVIHLTGLSKSWEEKAETSEMALEIKLDTAANLIRQDRMDEAKELLDYIIAADPENVKAYLALMKYYEIRNDPNELCSTGVRCLRLYRDDAFGVEKVYETIKNYVSGAKLSGEELLEIGKNLENIQRWEEALSLYMRVIKDFRQSGSLPKALLSGGRILAGKLNRKAEALKCFQQLTIEPFAQVWGEIAEKEIKSIEQH